MASMSRWFVGSSSSSTSGCATSDAREQHTASPAARERRYDRVGRKPEPGNHHVDADIDVPAIDVMELVEAVRHDLPHAAFRRERNILLEAGDAKSGLPPHGAGIGDDVAADDAQERRFAGSVSPDYTYALARLNQQVRIIEQRQMAIGHLDVVERHERHGLGVGADGVEEHSAEVVGLSRADALDRQKRVNRRGTKPGHLAQRGVVEYDVGRNAARPRDLEADRS